MGDFLPYVSRSSEVTNSRVDARAHRTPVEAPHRLVIRGTDVWNTGVRHARDGAAVGASPVLVEYTVGVGRSALFWRRVVDLRAGVVLVRWCKCQRPLFKPSETRSCHIRK